MELQKDLNLLTFEVSKEDNENEPVLQQYSLKNMNITNEKKTLNRFELIDVMLGLYLNLFFLAILYYCLAKSSISLSILIFTCLLPLFSVLTYIFQVSRHRRYLWFILFTLFHEIYNHFILIMMGYFLLVLGNIHLPIQVIASDLEEWINQYGHAASYNVLYYGLIALAPFIIFFCFLNYLIQTTILHIDEEDKEHKNGGMIFDRFLLANVFMHGVFMIVFGLILQLKAVWNSLPFVIILIIVAIANFVLLFMWLFFGRKRKYHQESNQAEENMFKASMALVALHVVLFTFVWIYRTNLYSNNPIIFNANYDSGFIQRYFNEEKYYFTGDYEQMTQCPKEITVFNWEDSQNVYGCLNMKTYHKVKMVTSILFDIILLIPVFDLFILGINYLENDDINRGSQMMRKDTYLNQGFTEKLLYGIDYVFLVGVIAYFIAAMCYQLTQPASYLHLPQSKMGIDNLKFIDLIIPPTLANPEFNLENEYVLSGKVVHDYNIDVSLTLMHLNSKENITSVIRTNEPFQIGKLYAYKGNIPIDYAIILTVDKEEANYGDVRIGGLVTGQFVQLGEIPLLTGTASSIKGRIQGKLIEEESLSAVYNANIYILKGMAMSLFTKDDVTGKTEFVPKNFLYTTRSDSGGLFEFNYIPQGYYTIIVVHADYYIETTLCSIIRQNDTISSSLFLQPKVKKDQMRIILDWFKAPKDLDLSISVASEGKVQCIAGYMNDYCGNTQLVTQSNFGGHEGNEIIHIGYLSNYTYKVVVNKYKSRHDGFVTTKFGPKFMKEDKTVLIEDLELSQSNAKIKVYVYEYKVPLLNANVPIYLNGNEWNVFEMNGVNGIGSIPSLFPKQKSLFHSSIDSTCIFLNSESQCLN